MRLGLLGARFVPAGRASTVVGIGLTAVLVAITIPWVGGRINEASAEESIASQAVTRLNQMTDAVAAVGGHTGVFPCKSSFAAVNHSVQTALAWKLHVTLGRVGTTMRHQGVMFVGPHDSIDGIAPPIDHRLTQRQLIAQVGALEDVPDDRPELGLQLRRLSLRSASMGPSGPSDHTAAQPGRQPPGLQNLTITTFRQPCHVMHVGHARPTEARRLAPNVRPRMLARPVRPTLQPSARFPRHR